METKAIRFFYENAGCSYNPETETQEQGRWRGARALARAETVARNRGFSYSWSVCRDTDSSDFSDDTPPWQLWDCVMFNADGKCVNSLHAIDFGRDGDPHSDSYRRVVEAELAIDGLTNRPMP